MAKYNYDLLSVHTKNNGKNRLIAEGALANQGVDVLKRYSLAGTVLGMLARLKSSKEINLLSLEFEVDTDKGLLSCQAKGRMSSLVAKELEKFRDRVQVLGRPIAVREGGFVYNLYQPPIPSQRFINSMSRLVVQGRELIRPATCTLQVTTKCQLNCYHCSAARYKTDRRTELTAEEMKSVIRQAEALGCFNIVFTGGEPLLRRDIFELISFINRDRAHPSMFTNGLLLTEENISHLCDAGLHSVMVSLDDPRSHVHDELRRIPGGFDKAVAGITRALEAGILVGISTYAGPEDVREGRVKQMIELGKKLGVHEVTIFDIVPTGKLLQSQEEQLLSAEDKRQLIEMEREYNTMEGYPHIITQALVNGPEGSGCFGGFSQFYMTAYGDIDPCDFTPLTFGNIRDEALEDIWQRMLTHPAYAQRCNHCRMQDPAFRSLYIDSIPEDVILPWPAFDELMNRPNSPMSACTAIR